MKKLLTLTLAAAVLFSCRKEKPDPITVSQGKDLVVTLSPAYLSGSQIDSAIMTWETSGQQKIVKLPVVENRLSTNLNVLNEGLGTMTIQLYTHKLAGNDQPLVFESVSNLDLRHANVVNIGGPQSLNDITWKPRFYLDFTRYNQTYTAIVGIRPNDPYFEIRVPNGYNQQLKVERVYRQSGTTADIAALTWDCQSNCPTNGKVVNAEFFQGLPQQINNRPYDQVFGEVSFYMSPTERWITHYELYL